MALRRLILSVDSVETHAAQREMYLRFQAITPLDKQNRFPVAVAVAKDEELGHGAQGCVYRGTLDGGGTCAVKKFGCIEDFRQELKNLNLVRTVRGCIKAIGYTDNGSGWILFPLYWGSLTQLFKTEPSGSISDVAFLDNIGTLFQTLCALHKAGFIHLDVKPSNVLCDHRPEAGYRLIDFGTLGCKQRYSAVACFSEYGRREPAGWKSDVFSAGATALETLVWKDKGPKGVESFRSERSREQYESDDSEGTAFFDIKDPVTGSWYLSKVVQNRLNEFAKRIPERVAVIKGMLEQRLSMEDAAIMWKEASLITQRRTIETYTPASDPNPTHHTHQGPHTNRSSTLRNPRVVNMSTQQSQSLNGTTGYSRTATKGHSRLGSPTNTFVTDEPNRRTPLYPPPQHGRK